MIHFRNQCVTGEGVCPFSGTQCLVLMDILSPSEKTKVEVIQGDITDYSGVLEASRGVDVIIHTASLVDVWHKIPDSLIYSVNINGETPTGLVRKKSGMARKPHSHPGSHEPEETSCSCGGVSRTSISWWFTNYCMLLRNIKVSGTAVEQRVPEMKTGFNF